MNNNCSSKSKIIRFPRILLFDIHLFTSWNHVNCGKNSICHYWVFILDFCQLLSVYKQNISWFELNSIHDPLFIKEIFWNISRNECGFELHMVLHRSRMVGIKGGAAAVQFSYQSNISKWNHKRKKYPKSKKNIFFIF